MASLVAQVKVTLEEHGEYVVLANLETGWFAINPNTWEKRVECCKRMGRVGPNLIVYRTKSDEERDHHVIPNEVIAPMLSQESLKQQKNGTFRWNLTLANDRLHVSHRTGYEKVEKYLSASLASELNTPSGDSGILTGIVNLRTRSFEGIIEGIARVGRNELRRMVNAGMVEKLLRGSFNGCLSGSNQVAFNPAAHCNAPYKTQMLMAIY